MKTKTKEIVNLLQDPARAIEGKDYYFQTVHGIDRGTCVRCEKCDKACVSNAVKILSFNQKEITIKVSQELKDAPELAGYDEESGLCLCENCAQ